MKKNFEKEVALIEVREMIREITGKQWDCSLEPTSPCSGKLDLFLKLEGGLAIVITFSDPITEPSACITSLSFGYIFLDVERTKALNSIVSDERIKGRIFQILESYSDSLKEQYNQIRHTR